jgi:hypothetical protein
MNLIRIEPAWRQWERHIFECRDCGRSESYTGSTAAGETAPLASQNISKEVPS